MIAYASTTENITVTVRPGYLDEHSDFMNKKFVFGYFIRIENNRNQPVQLLRRYWTISEYTGRVEEVEGDGVIGKQPVIHPGDTYEYTSFCILRSFTGWMEGSYLMQDADGRQFYTSIPRFELRAAAN